MRKPPPPQELIDAASAVRVQREMLELQLSGCRRTSRDLALRLLIEFEQPLDRVSRLTGHHRPTLKSWLDVELAKGKDSLFLPQDDTPPMFD